MLFLHDKLESDVFGLRQDKQSDASFDEELKDEVLEVRDYVLWDFVAKDEFAGARAFVKVALIFWLC